MHTGVDAWAHCANPPRAPHTVLVQVVCALAVGTCSALLFACTGSVGACIVLHALANTLGALVPTDGRFDLLHPVILSGCLYTLVSHAALSLVYGIELRSLTRTEFESRHAHVLCRASNGRIGSDADVFMASREPSGGLFAVAEVGGGAVRPRGRSSRPHAAPR